MSDDRQRALRRADPQADRRLAGAPAHRLRRPLPVPPLRRPDAAGGDDGGARPRSCARQGPLHRLQRVARGEDRRVARAARASSAGSPASRSTRCCGAQPEARGDPAVRARGISQIVWSPLAQGVLTGKYRPGEPPPPDSRAASESMSGFIDRLIAPPVLEAVSACGRRREGRADDAPARARVGAARAATSPRRSSARAGPSRCARTPPRRG